ncbi:MAG TPA: hypothetical protein VFP72_15165 [Kineosporiaceae bacterium]|nr:hypothetical protein [Kineosporiaceae bacterium]
MTTVGRVSPVEVLRAQRKEAPFRKLPEGPPMLTNVTFTQQDLHAHQPQPVQVPPPAPISIAEQIDLTIPMRNSTVLIAMEMTLSIPPPGVTYPAVIAAQVRAYTGHV